MTSSCFFAYKKIIEVLYNRFCSMFGFLYFVERNLKRMFDLRPSERGMNERNIRNVLVP